MKLNQNQVKALAKEIYRQLEPEWNEKKSKRIKSYKELLIDKIKTEYNVVYKLLSNIDKGIIDWIKFNKELISPLFPYRTYYNSCYSSVDAFVDEIVESNWDEDFKKTYKLKPTLSNIENCITLETIWASTVWELIEWVKKSFE